MVATHTVEVGMQVRIKTMARTDAIGTIVELPSQFTAVVRLDNWQADGSPLILKVSCDELVEV